MSKASIATLMLLCMAGAATAQSADPITLRVGKLEKEMKAVQRKVFPGGVALEPEIGGTTVPGIAAGTPATTPIADLNARVDALETQLRTLTGQVETDGNRIRKLEEAVRALQPAPAAPISGTADQPTAASEGATPTSAPLTRPTAPKPATVAKPDAGRRAAIDAVEVPVTGDAIEDAYTYGFRLWQAKLYPEAQVKLKEFVAKHPSHKRASYAQNLLGRAYLDEGKPALASVAFYDNYQKYPRGDRAAESLSWLGSALIRLKKPADACKVYKEFDDVYGARANAEVKARVAKGKTDARCTA